MIELTAARAAEFAQARLVGDGQTPLGPDVVIDARLATPGSIFVAIPGERVDGHDYTEQAAANGAAAVIATRETAAELPHLLVDDSVAGLSHLAHGVVEAARPHGLQTLAITGSSGKTSTKDLLAQVLEADGETVSPLGSFNNEIGVPLTACGVGEHTRHLVSEMGARGIGHVAHLCRIVRPDISLVLNVGSAHLGEFGSRENIAQAKGEIVEALPADGWAVLNADDELVAAMAERTGAHLAWWTRTDFAHQGGTAPEGALHVRAVDISSNALQQYAFTLVVERDGQITRHDVQLRLLGSHQVSNALAAATAALAAGMAPAAVANALGEATTRSHWRMELVETPAGAAILNDAYNANPDSMAAAIDTIGEIGRARRAECPTAKVYAVLGDMLELGGSSDQLHAAIGRRAVERGVDHVFCVGEHARHIAEGARAAGGVAEVSTRDEVPARLPLAAGDVVLVKASRGIGLEVVADRLARQGEGDDRRTAGEES